jgi:hypothetical protein
MPGDTEAERLMLRYSPGEDARPLLGALAGGIVGAVLALAIDRIIPSPVPGQLIWPALMTAALPLGGTVAGAVLLVAAAALAALVFVYGQFRRFVPGPPWAAGVVWGVVAAAVVGSTLVPRAAPWLSAQDGVDAGTTVVAASLVVLEVTIGSLLYGICVGVLNPRRGKDST